MSTRNKRHFSLWQPKYWPIWLGFGLLRLMSYLPLSWLYCLGKRLGRLLSYGKRARHVATVNIALCFPELSATEHEKLIREMFESLGISVFETAIAWWGSAKRIQSLVEVKGLEHIDAALAANTPVITLGGHFVTAELAARAAAEKAQFTFKAVYQKAKNPAIDTIVNTSRLRHLDGLIASHDVRGMLNCAEQRIPFWFAPDQNIRKKNQIFAPFFGQLAQTSITIVTLCNLSGAKVLPITYYRKKDRTYVVTVEKPLEDFPKTSDEENAVLLNEIMEKMIRAYPEQYLWTYKRFRKRPKGLPKLYKKI